MSALPHGRYIPVRERMLHEEIEQRRVEYAREREIEQIEQAMRIAYLTAAHFNLTLRSLLTMRSHPMADRRRIAMYLIRQITGLGIPRIGRMFDRDQYVVWRGCQRVQREIAGSQAFARLVEELRMSIKEMGDAI